uniref:ABC transporter domain-containing protein n=2 Tax=Mesocestoides corti TaxID=53468 RepID=A0A5K3G507_MESCO
DPNNSTRDVVRVVNLSKQFSKRKVPAVNDLTFGVRLGECFGLLGVNGAGKSTTFNMLTTNIRPSTGTISIDGIDVFSNPNLHEVIAYCPQFNPLHTHLTGFETLQLYARIRGYPESTISSVADRLIDQLCLRP